jgi:hypothetical protein
LEESFIEEGGPIAIAEVDGEGWAFFIEELLEGADDGEVLFVDRGLAAEVEVVLGDLLEAIAGDATAAGDVFKEGDYVFGGVGPAEADKKNCVGHGSN